MSRKRTRNRIYPRSQGGLTRYYADFRDYADVGGSREGLVVPGERLATKDAELAEALAAKRLTELQRKRTTAQGRAVADLPPLTTLAVWAREHLVAKAKAGRVTDQWMEGEELRLRRAVEHLGADRDLSSIAVADARRWAEALSTGGLSGGTVRQHLNSLSNLYRRAQAEGKVVPGYNPVAAMMDKPSAGHEEAHWLEVPAAALLLEAARTYQPKRDDIAISFAYPLLATFLLTGGRPAEVLGLEVDDISLTRETLTFRPNAHRRLKTLTSPRTLPLWPQLAEILRAYFPERERMAGGSLLFPSLRAGEPTMLTDCRKLLDAIGARVGYQPRELNLYDFRHTYCATRLQTLDGGAPVSPYTVGRELGHGGARLVQAVYGHLGAVRHRANVVEYRARQHRAVKHRDKPVREWLKMLATADRQ
jgi:integrase